MSTKEEAFFGVKNTIALPEVESDDFEIEVVDDTPEEDRVYARNKPKDSDPNEEIESVGNRAKERINKLKYEYHEERRAKEAAQRMSEEAVVAAERLQNENRRLLELINKSKDAINTEATKRADADIRSAQDEFKRALDSDDNSAIVDAQQKLTIAQMARASAENSSDHLIRNWLQEFGPEDVPSPKQNQFQEMDIQPDPKALVWQEENPWFGQDEEMTSFAYGVHDKIVRGGVDPQSDEYYTLINKRMREVFPSHFNVDTDDQHDSNVIVDTAPRQKANPVVAPAGRGSKAAPRKITLTQTQIKLAKRLGLSPQQYAAQLLKENS